MTKTLCNYCGRGITNVGSDGKVYNSWIHTDGPQKHLHRCWTGDTGKHYGLNAEPKEEI